MGAGRVVAGPAGRAVPAVPGREGGRMRLKGTCRLCRYPVTLEADGLWSHGASISAAMAHSVAVAVRRFVRQVEQEGQADYALAGPARGSK